MSHEGGHAPARILVVSGDDSLAYLLGRFAVRSGLALDLVAEPPSTPPRGADAALVWFPSFDRLAAWRGTSGGDDAHGHTGTDGGDGSDPAVVVSTPFADERRARELGADYCALLPLTYDDFIAAVSAVGVQLPAR